MQPDNVIQDTKKCDDCGIQHDKTELVRYFQGHYFICRSCIADYDRMYKKEKK